MQLTRQLLRITVFSIGFVLFIIVAVKSAAQATDRRAVVGKPSLLPATAVAAAGPLPQVSAGTPLSAQTASIAVVRSEHAPVTSGLAAVQVAANRQESEISSSGTAKGNTENNENVQKMNAPGKYKGESPGQAKVKHSATDY